MDVVDYLQHFVVVYVVPHQPRQALQVLELQQFIFVFVQVLEDRAHAFFGFDIAHFRHHQLQELFEVDWFVLGLQTADQAVDEGVFSAFAQLSQDLIDLFGVDEAGMVLVEEVEGVLEALVLFGM